MPNTTSEFSYSAASRVITDLALAMNEGLAVRGVTSLVVEKAVAALGASAGSVMMPSDDGSMRVVATIGRVAQESENGAEEIGREHPESPVAAWVVRNDQPVLLIGRSGPLAHLLHREDIRDAVCVPLRYAGQPIGALSVSNSRARGPFSQNDVELLTAIGHLAAVALHNTRLYDEARSDRERLQAVLHRLWTAQEEERRHLAADLHDGPAQSLFHIVFRLQMAKGQALSDPGGVDGLLSGTEAAARETLAQVRAIMAGLRPMSLDDLGLVPALQNEAAAITARGRVRVDVEISGEPRRLSEDVETGLYRIAREALSNVERHAEVAQARMEVCFTSVDVTIRVEDAGIGFDAETARAAHRAGRIGLDALRERAEALGASLNIASDRGQGTRIIARYRWPDAGPLNQESIGVPSEKTGTHARRQARCKENQP